MRRLSPKSLPLLAPLLLLLAGAGAAQPEDEVWLGTDTGVERIPLLVSPLLGDESAAA